MGLNESIVGISGAVESCQTRLTETCLATCNGVEQRIAWFSLTVLVAMLLKQVIKKNFTFENGELLRDKAKWMWCSGGVLVQLAKTAELYLDLIMWTTGIAMAYVGFISMFF